jgi:hypothetical protein
LAEFVESTTQLLARMVSVYQREVRTMPNYLGFGHETLQ